MLNDFFSIDIVPLDLDFWTYANSISCKAFKASSKISRIVEERAIMFFTLFIDTLVRSLIIFLWFSKCTLASALVVRLYRNAKFKKNRMYLRVEWSVYFIYPLSNRSLQILGLFQQHSVHWSWIGKNCKQRPTLSEL